MKSLSLLLALSIVLIATAFATPLERDLGQGLRYLRIQELPGDLPEKNPPQACVLDLRYTTGDSEAADRLATWLQSHASTRQPVFILTNPQTSASILKLLSRPSALSGILILGATTQDFAPDISIPTDPAQERRAYDALPATADLKTLISAFPEKTRHDEASIAKAKREGAPLDYGDDDTGTDPKPGDAAPTPPPLIDAVLQRAVQIHQGWLVLRTQ